MRTALSFTGAAGAAANFAAEAPLVTSFDTIQTATQNTWEAWLTRAVVATPHEADLQKFSETLKQYTDTDLLIVGHTDNVGSDAFNQTLSEKRASSVSNYLASLGISYNRLRIEGKGELQPTVSNDTESDRTQNRRVEIAISANEKMKADAKTEVKQ